MEVLVEDILEAAKEGLMALSVAVGPQVMPGMMEEEVTSIVGADTWTTGGSRYS